MGIPTSPAVEPTEETGSLTGAILARGQSARIEKEPRRANWRTTVTVTGAIVVFIGAIGMIVYALAGDFLRALFRTIMHLQ